MNYFKNRICFLLLPVVSLLSSCYVTAPVAYTPPPPPPAPAPAPVIVEAPPAYAPPVWAPAYEGQVRYYYLPDIQTYYDVYTRNFVYYDGFVWQQTAYLPPAYSSYNLNESYVVVLNSNVNQPWVNHSYYINNYPAGYYNQSGGNYSQPINGAQPNNRVATVGNSPVPAGEQQYHRPRGFNENGKSPLYVKPATPHNPNAGEYHAQPRPTNESPVNEQRERRSEGYHAAPNQSPTPAPAPAQSAPAPRTPAHPAPPAPAPVTVPQNNNQSKAPKKNQGYNPKQNQQPGQKYKANGEK